MTNEELQKTIFERIASPEKQLGVKNIMKLTQAIIDLQMQENKNRRQDRNHIVVGAGCDHYLLNRQEDPKHPPLILRRNIIETVQKSQADNGDWHIRISCEKYYATLVYKDKPLMDNEFYKIQNAIADEEPVLQEIQTKVEEDVEQDS